MGRAKMAKIANGQKPIDFYRDHPIEACEELFGIILSGHQKQGMMDLWNFPMPLMNWSRGMSKTFLVALYFLLRGTLFRGTKMGLIAPSFRQEKEIIEKANEIIDISREKGFVLLDRAIEKITVGANDAYIKFTNGSLMRCIPIGGAGKGSTSRGARFHIMFVDEYAFLDESIITRTVRPFLNVRSRNPIKYGRHTQNQLIVASSAWFSENHFYRMIESYKEAIAAGSDAHCVSQFNILDFVPTPDYNLDWDTVMESMRSMPRADFGMEYLNEFPSTSTPILGARSIKTMFDTIKTDKIVPELYRDGKSSYIEANDPAEVLGGDNACKIVMKLIKNTDGKPSFIVPVNIAAWNDGKSMSELSRLLKEDYISFSPEVLAIDTKGGGAEVIKQLATTDLDYDFSLVDVAAAQFIKTNEKSHPVIKPVVFSSKANSEMLSKTLLMIERGRVRFPRQIMIHEDNEINEIYRQLKFLKTEIMNLKPKQSGDSHVWVSSNKKSGKKDRAVAFIMACAVAYDRWFAAYEVGTRKRKKCKPRFGRIRL
jgi:hypothetical protein